MMNKQKLKMALTYLYEQSKSNYNCGKLNEECYEVLCQAIDFLFGIIELYGLDKEPVRAEMIPEEKLKIMIEKEKNRMKEECEKFNEDRKNEMKRKIKELEGRI